MFFSSELVDGAEMGWSGSELHSTSESPGDTPLSVFGGAGGWGVQCGLVVWCAGSPLGVVVVGDQDSPAGACLPSGCWHWSRLESRPETHGWGSCPVRFLFLSTTVASAGCVLYRYCKLVYIYVILVSICVETLRWCVCVCI